MFRAGKLICEEISTFLSAAKRLFFTYNVKVNWNSGSREKKVNWDFEETRQQPASGWREASWGVIQRNYVPWRAIEMRGNRRSLKTGNTTQDPLFSKSSKKFKKWSKNGSRKHAPLKPNRLFWGFRYQHMFSIFQITEVQQHCFFMLHLVAGSNVISKLHWKSIKSWLFCYTKKWNFFIFFKIRYLRNYFELEKNKNT